jgi:hypothetical protein
VRRWRERAWGGFGERAYPDPAIFTGKKHTPGIYAPMPEPIASVLADGVYDGAPVYRTIAECQPHALPAVIIPPRATAVLRPTPGTAPSLRDRHLQTIQEKGRRGWEKAVG